MKSFITKISLAAAFCTASLFSLSGCGGGGDDTVHVLPPGTQFSLSVGPAERTYLDGVEVDYIEKDIYAVIFFTSTEGLRGEIIADGSVFGCVYSVTGDINGKFDLEVSWGTLSLLGRHLSLKDVSFNNGYIYGTVTSWSTGSNTAYGYVTYEGTEGILTQAPQ